MRNTAPLVNPWVKESPTVTSRCAGSTGRTGASGASGPSATPTVGSLRGGRAMSLTTTSGGVRGSRYSGGNRLGIVTPLVDAFAGRQIRRSTSLANAPGVFQPDRGLTDGVVRTNCSAMRAGFGGWMSVSTSTALIAAALAGGPLYVSATRSEALQLATAATCSTDTGLSIEIPDYVDASVIDQLDAAAVGVADVEPPIRSTARIVGFTALGVEQSLTDRLILLARSGQFEQLGAPVDRPPVADEVVLPRVGAERAGLVVGDTLLLATEGRPASEARLVGTYPDIPFLPEPSYWCGLRGWLRPNPSGDLPPPLALTDSSTFDHVDPGLVGRNWELRAIGGRLTAERATTLLGAYRRIAELYESQEQTARRAELDRGRYIQPPRPLPEPRLEVLLAQATTVSEVVRRTMAPVRWGGAASGVLLLVGAGVLVSRERRRELRLRVLRGDSPLQLGGRIAVAFALPVVAGGALGSVIAFVGVRALGPTAELELSPLRAAALSVGGATTGSLALFATVVALVADRALDPPPRRVRRAAPARLAVAALSGLTIAAWLRLDRVGGVRLVGGTADGGDLLAQAFPLLGLSTPLALLAWPVRRLARRARTFGRGLPTAVLIGVRRIGAAPATSTMSALATALGVGSFLLAGSMTGSARHLLDDKAATYLGGDQVISVIEGGPIPAGLTATIVARARLGTDDGPVNVLGVDRSTFAEIVRWRGDAAAAPLDELLARIDEAPAVEPLAALVVGDPLPSTTLRSTSRDELRIDPVGSARWFPGERAGIGYVVVDHDALVATRLPMIEEVWVRDPPDDARERLEAAGFDVRGVRRAGDVFDVLSFRAVQWSYAPLRAFGTVIGIVVVAGQLLVLEARRRTRQVAGVLTSAMGLGPRQSAFAGAVELGLPALVGAILGAALSVGVLHLAVGQLDGLRHLPPPARAVFELQPVLATAAVGAVAVTVLSVIGEIVVRRGRPMEVLRDLG